MDYNGSNKRSIMTELEQTLKDLEQGKISADHAEAVILRLFSVINRRELLLAFLQYLDKDKPQTWFTHEPIINDFLSKQ